MKYGEIRGNCDVCDKEVIIYGELSTKKDTGILYGKGIKKEFLCLECLKLVYNKIGINKLFEKIKHETNSQGIVCS